MNSPDHKQLSGIIAVVIAAILWGTTGTAAALAPQLSPLAIGAVAMGVGGLLQGAIAIGEILRQRLAIYQQWRYWLLGLGAVALYPLAFYTAMRLAGVAVGTVISIGSAPLFSAFIEYQWEGVSLTKQWRWGATVGMLGMALLTLASQQNQIITSGREALLGIFLGLIAGLTYALYSWSARRLMQKGITPRAAMGATFSGGGLLLMPLLGITGAPLLDSWLNAGVGIYMALIPMFVGYLCYGMGLARIRASTAITLTLLEPVVATLLAVSWLGEHLSVVGWIGMGLIIICLIIISLPSQRSDPDSEVGSGFS